MQNNILNKINVSTRILIIILLILCVFIANSIYFLAFMTIFIVILSLLINKSVKYYIKLIENSKIWLLFMFIVYIIVFRNIFASFLFVYKLCIILIMLMQFSLIVNFQSLSNGIKTLLKPLIKINILNKIVYELTLLLYYLKIYIFSKDEVFLNYNSIQKIKYTFSLKHNVFPRIFLTNLRINQLESSLKIKFYDLKTEEKDMKSNIILLLFVLLFIIVIIREVIL